MNFVVWVIPEYSPLFCMTETTYEIELFETIWGTV